MTLMAVAISAFVWIAQYSPETFFYATLFSSAVGLLGFGIVVFSIVLLFSVYVSDSTNERKLNIAKCTNLILIGTLMIALPLFSALTTIFLLPIIGGR